MIAINAADRISEIFHLDNQLDDLTKTERKRRRRKEVKPKVDAFFTWAKDAIGKIPAKGKTADALQYCINQEKYLRVFLDDANVPMDNNRAEQAIRPFTLGRKNWVNMFSTNGAQASAVIYSIVETAKANGLNVNAYLEYLLRELSAHADDPKENYITRLLPWSKEAKKLCTNTKYLKQ
ncbi:MAG: transposase [Lachnospiraceae bacterium]|nr:transposase [Lachnospiraceae bacterium]